MEYCRNIPSILRCYVGCNTGIFINFLQKNFEKKNFIIKNKSILIFPNVILKFNINSVITIIFEVSKFLYESCLQILHNSNFLNWSLREINSHHSYNMSIIFFSNENLSFLVIKT